MANFLPTLTTKAKDFAAELTSHNVIEKDLSGEKAISTEHVENNRAIRKMENFYLRRVQACNLNPDFDSI